MREATAECLRAARELALPTLADPERRRKISEANRGRVLGAESRAAMSRASTGRKHTEQTRQKRREAQARRPAGVPGGPWSEEEDELVRTLSVAEVVRRTGRTPNAVYKRRRELKAGQKRGRTTTG
jgi:hypothetical protein